MLMTSEVSVEAVAQNFLAGNYTLDFAALEQTPVGPALKNRAPD